MSEKRKSPVPDDRRDAEIARLEAEVAAEREHSAGLLQAADELRFQKEILERSYAKQLEDLRGRLAGAEAELAAGREQCDELAASRDEALQMLARAEDKARGAATERDQLRRQLTSRDGWQVESAGGEPEDFGDEGTINALMNDASWSRRAQAAKASGTAAKGEEASAAGAPDPDDVPVEEMISPELVLAAGRARD